MDTCLGAELLQFNLICQIESDFILHIRFQASRSLLAEDVVQERAFILPTTDDWLCTGRSKAEPACAGAHTAAEGGPRLCSRGGQGNLL